MILTALHPIEEAVRSRPGQIEWVLFDSERRDRRIHDLERLCRQHGVSVRQGDRRALDRAAAGSRHQGAVARTAAREYLPSERALEGPRGGRFLLILDQIQDPQNLGAILRVADAVGAMIVLPERRSAPLSDAVARSSAGAVERVPVVRVGNLHRFIELLKKEGFRIVGLDAGGADLYALDLAGDLALVLGAEGTGMRRLVREACDLLARLPMRGTVASLNVATAASAAAYEVVRQRNFSSQTP